MLNQKIKTLRLEGGWVQGGEPFLPLHLTKYPWSKAVIPSDSQILKSQLISLLTRQPLSRHGRAKGQT